MSPRKGETAVHCFTEVDWVSNLSGYLLSLSVCDWQRSVTVWLTCILASFWPRPRRGVHTIAIDGIIANPVYLSEAVDSCFALDGAHQHCAQWITLCLSNQLFELICSFPAEIVCYLPACWKPPTNGLCKTHYKLWEMLSHIRLLCLLLICLSFRLRD